MLDARLKLVYLLAVVIAGLCLKTPVYLAGLLGVQLLLWVWLRLPYRRMSRILWRSAGLTGFVALSYLLFEPVSRPAGVAAQSWPEQWVWQATQAITRSWELGVRLLIVILCSTVVRESGRPGEFVRGLCQLRLPVTLALALETTLTLLQPAERTRGSGRSGQGPVAGLRRLFRPDISGIAAQLHAAIQRAHAHLAGSGLSAPPPQVNDIAVISGVAVLMMTVRFMKLLPGIPFAPGHKLILLIPLYVVARRLTASRSAATLTGVTVGVLAFLSGEGRFGVFEVLKHAAPGLVVDLLAPGGSSSVVSKRIVVYSIIGALAGVASYTATAAIALLLQAPAATLALLAPFGLSQVLCGAASGPITSALVTAIDRRYRAQLDRIKPFIEGEAVWQTSAAETDDRNRTTSFPG